MLTLHSPTQREYEHWFEQSVARQAEDRAWIAGTAAREERTQLDMMVPQLLPQGKDTPGHVFRLARNADKQVVGFAWFAQLPGMPDDARMILDVFVDEGHRNRGYGRCLLERMMISLQQQGARHFVLNVRSDNTSARALYARLGFRETEPENQEKHLEMAWSAHSGSPDPGPAELS